MKKVLRFIFFLLRNLISKNWRYVRIGPNEKGRILFFDKKRRKLFSVYSRGSTDSITADQIFTSHDYDLSFLRRGDEIQRRYNDIINTGKLPLIIDCGANIGLATKYFAEEYPDALVISLEPDAENMRLANENCREINNIIFKNSAIGSDVGFVRIEDESVNPNSFRVSRTSSSDAIPVETIQKIHDQFKNSVLFIVKVDIEGFESDLFSNNIGWVNVCELLVVELHDWMLPNTANSFNFLKAICTWRRDFVYKGENIFSIKNLQS